jgi:hypothetical protein
MVTLVPIAFSTSVTRFGSNGGSGAALAVALTTARGGAALADCAGPSFAAATGLGTSLHPAPSAKTARKRAHFGIDSTF